jgi:hypothetical protein
LADRILPADLDFTARDHDSLDDRLQRGIESVFQYWSDRSTANFGNILRNMMAHIGDVLQKYQQAQGAESRFVTCTRRINGVRHARPLGYTFRQQTASAATVRFTLNGTYAAIPVLAGSVIRSPSATNPARYQVLADVTIPAGVSTYDVAVENSSSWEEVFPSTGLASQEFLLLYSPYLEIIGVGDDITPIGAVTPWSEVTTFIDSVAADPHYRVLLSDGGRAIVRMGDGNLGRIPNGTITIRYKTGGGAVRVDQGTLTVPEFSLVDGLGAQVNFSVTNPSPASSGLDSETLAEAQERVPKTLRTNQRSVTWGDFKIVAEGVDDVARAIILTSDQMTGIAENYGHLYVVARGLQLSSGSYAPAVPSQALLDAVRDAIDNDQKSTITFAYDVLAAPYLTINIVARVRLKQGANESTVAAAIRAHLADRFAVVDEDGRQNEDLAFGYEMKDELGSVWNRLPWSDLFGVVLGTAGVRSVDEDVFEPYDDVEIPMNSLPALGTVTLINDRTGLAM